MNEKFREVFYFKQYFREFLGKQRKKVITKIIWTLDLIEAIQFPSAQYLKQLEGNDGLFEIRVISDGDIFRIFCCFDEEKLVVLMNGFQKKTQHSPKREIERALRIMEEYYAEKQQFNVTS
jgi:phage-related protein